jgi:hypothetical protein
VNEKIVIEQGRRQHKRKKRRVVSGSLLEEGDGPKLRGLRGGARYEKYEKDEYDDDGGGNKKKRLCRPSHVVGLCEKIYELTLNIRDMSRYIYSAFSYYNTGSGCCQQKEKLKVELKWIRQRKWKPE